MTRTFLFLTIAFVIAGCNRSPEKDLFTQRFIGNWQTPDGQYHIAISPEMAVKGTLLIGFSEVRSKAEPGIVYEEGNWAIMGGGTSLLFSKTIDGLEYVVDAANWSVVPKYTSVKLMEAASDGNVYLKRRYGNAFINAKARKRNEVLDVYVDLRPKSPSAAPPKEIVLFTATLRGDSLCLSSREFTFIEGFSSECLRASAKK